MFAMTDASQPRGVNSPEVLLALVDSMSDATQPRTKLSGKASSFLPPWKNRLTKLTDDADAGGAAAGDCAQKMRSTPSTRIVRRTGAASERRLRSALCIILRRRSAQYARELEGVTSREARSTPQEELEGVNDEP